MYVHVRTVTRRLSLIQWSSLFYYISSRLAWHAFLPLLLLLLPHSRWQQRKWDQNSRNDLIMAEGVSEGGLLTLCYVYIYICSYSLKNKQGTFLSWLLTVGKFKTEQRWNFLFEMSFILAHRQNMQLKRTRVRTHKRMYSTYSSFNTVFSR